MSAPTPFECFCAGAFFAFVAASNGQGMRSFTEDEVRQAMRDWLEERAAEAAAMT